MDRKTLRKFISFGAPALLGLTRIALPLLTRKPRDKSLVLVKLAGMGDTALMLPMIGMLRKTFPDFRIQAVVTPITKPLLKACPDLDGILMYDPLGADKGFWGLLRHLLLLRRNRYQVFVDFEQHIQMIPFLGAVSGAGIRVGLLHPDHNRGRLFSHPVAYDDRRRMVRTFHAVYATVCRALGRPAIPFEEAFGYTIPFSGDALVKVKEWKSRHAAGRLLVGMHPGCSPNNVNKRWPKERFREVIRRLAGTGRFHVVITGGPDERDLMKELAEGFGAEAVSQGTGFNFDEFVALIGSMDCFICNDTGPVHIGPWAGTRTIGIFGPETPDRYGTEHPDSVSLYRAMACSPCIQVHKGMSPDCSYHDRAACIRQITVDDVYGAVLRLTAGSAGNEDGLPREIPDSQVAGGR